jgi:hypothetical protein
MMHRDSECALCERIVTSEDVESQRCSGCNAIICEAHTGDPDDPHEPEDHIGAEDVEDDEEPVEDER